RIVWITGHLRDLAPPVVILDFSQYTAVCDTQAADCGDDFSHCDSSNFVGSGTHRSPDRRAYGSSGVYYLLSARPTNLRSCTLTRTLSPVATYSGTCTVRPVDSVAGLVLDVAEPPLIEGSVSI